MEPSQNTTIQINENIILTPKEQKIFSILLDICQKRNLKTVLRVAGGWVRDKLMGKESADIDIALNNLPGEEFAKIVNQELDQIHDTQHTSKIGVVKKNSEKSKHLETAIIRIENVWIDLVNLRTEDYTQNSRIPTIECGTPEEDAFRRDLTINSLFYNINENKIEDCTKMGIHDLVNGIIRTPLDPRLTFLDDPLRILRIVRFAFRYGFKITEEIDAAARDPEIQIALATKVSHERIGIEMDKILLGNDAIEAMKYLYNYKIIKYLIKVPPNVSELSNDEIIEEKIFIGIKYLQILDKLHKILLDNPQPFLNHSNISFFDQNKLEIVYSAMVMPFKNYEYKIKNKSHKVYEHILLESLKKKKSIAKFAENTIENITKIRNLASSLFSIVDAGFFMKKNGELYDIIVFFAMAEEYYERFLQNNNTVDNNIEEEKLKILSIQYCNLNENIDDAQLAYIHKKKPLLSGGEIIKLFQIKEGKIIGKIIEEQMKWEFLNPNGTKEECQEYLLSHKSNFL